MLIGQQTFKLHKLSMPKICLHVVFSTEAASGYTSVILCSGRWTMRYCLGILHFYSSLLKRMFGLCFMKAL